jgi:hypothetical protein
MRRREHRIHADQHLPGGDRLALLHQDLFHDPLLGGLHDLEVARRHELAVGHGDDVQAAECSPEQDTAH